MIFKNTIILILTRYSLIPLNIATGILLARLLGPSDLGNYALMMWLPDILSNPMGLGIGTANLYYCVKDKGLTRPLVANSLFITILLSVCVFVFIFTLLSIFPNKIPFQLEKVFILIPLSNVPFRLMIRFMQNIFNAHEDQITYRRTELVDTIIYFLLCFSIVFLFESKLWGFIFARLITSIMTFFFTMYIVYRHNFLSIKVDLLLLKNSISYGIKAQIASSIRVASEKTDELIILHFSGAKVLGYLTVIRNLTNRLQIIPNSLENIIAPKFSSDDGKSAAIAVENGRRLITLMAFVSISIALVAGILIPFVYGDAYSGLVGPLRIMIFSIVPFSLSRIISSYLLLSGFPSKIAVVSLISAVLLILMDFLFIPIFGLYGAVIAGFISMIFQCAIYIFIFMNHTTVHFSKLLMPTKEDFFKFCSIFSKIKSRVFNKP